jgi:hypothetical protein
MSDLVLVKACQELLDSAQRQLTLAVIDAYPMGGRVKVRLSSAPNHGSTWGRVVGHGAGKFAGEVRLRLETHTKLVREFPWERIEQ